jgi:hypothetical protein
MVPGRLSVFHKLASPRRYTDKSYMKKLHLKSTAEHHAKIRN